MTSPPLARRLGLGGAVAIGLASMIGAGVFAAFAPAAAAAGDALLVALAAAAFVAFANASSTAQLAASYPQAGGVYHYGRQTLGEWPGYLAGWGFVVGKTASCAAMAITAAAYLAPSGWERPLGVAAVVVLTAVNLAGVTRTAAVAIGIVSAVVAVLVVVIVSGAAPAGAAATASPAWSFADAVSPGELGWVGVLQAAGLLFFAFAGYARIATLGEEVRDPERTIPRAILGAFAGVVVLYTLLAITALASVGSERLAAASAPLVEVVAANGWEAAAPFVRAAAGLGALGALLALIAGVGRTTFAMARDGELPRPLARVGSRGVPWVAEAVVAVVVVVLVAVGDLRGAIGFSSFGVLVYYLIANAAALAQPRAARRFPRALSLAGAIGCLVLVATLPPPSVMLGLAVFAVGVAVRLAGRARRRSR